MDIFGKHVPFTKVENKVKSADIRTVIEKIETQIFRVSQNIGLYKTALLSAENIQYPSRYLLYQTYNQITLDSHLTACMQQRKNLTLSRSFKVMDKAGKENEKLSEIIDAKWFRDFLNLSLDSLFWGYSLVQFDGLQNDSFKTTELVPRQYVKPEFSIVVKSWGDITGIDYTELPYSDWCIGVGQKRDLGLLMKAAPLIIWKTAALGAWAQHQEIFGSPIRIGKTNKRDKASIDKMDAMLQNMGTSSWARFDPDDVIELIESNKQDAYMVFDMLIERCNSEIAKLILGQTGTTAEKSFVGSAEVHERILQKYAENDEHFITNVLNYQLIPMLENLGIKFNGAKIQCVEDDELTLVERSLIELKLLETYDIEPEYIEKVYGTPVVKRAIPIDTGIKNVQNKLNDYYN